MTNDTAKNVSIAQPDHWKETFLEPEVFGESPSYASVNSLETMKRYGVSALLELGAGQG